VAAGGSYEVGISYSSIGERLAGRTDTSLSEGKKIGWRSTAR
jgi:hypothetical protein